MCKIIVCLSAALLLTSSAIGQTATGTVRGRVTDASGASVADAKVIVENSATGVKQELTTSSAGTFAQPYLQPGEYRVTVEKSGFQSSVTTGVRLNVQQIIDLEVPLKVGQMATTVEVSASAAQLSTSTSSVSTVIQGKAVLDLPLNGRNPFSLATLTPGVIPGGGSTPWISGGRNASSEITIDGTSVIIPENNVSINATGYTPIADSIAEFNVITIESRVI